MMFFCKILSHSSSHGEAVMYSLLTSECKQVRVLLKIHKVGFPGKKKTYKMALSAPYFAYNIYKPVCLQNRISFCILMLASSTWLLGLW